METFTIRSLRAASRCGLGGLILLSATACGDDDDATNELEAARERWEEHGPDAYRMTVTVSCFCGEDVTEPRTITVENGTATEVDRPIPEDGTVVAHTVPSLFNLVDEALDTADATSVDYHGNYGYPVSIYVDELENAVDDEMDYSVDNFVPLD